MIKYVVNHLNKIYIVTINKNNNCDYYECVGPLALDLKM